MKLLNLSTSIQG